MSGHYPGNYNSYDYPYRDHDRVTYPARGGSSFRGRRGGYASGSYYNGSSYTPGQTQKSSNVYRPGYQEGSTYIPNNYSKKETHLDSNDTQESVDDSSSTVSSNNDQTIEKTQPNEDQQNHSQSIAENINEQNKESSYGLDFNRQFATNRDPSSTYRSISNNRTHSYRGGYRTNRSSFQPYNIQTHTYHNRFHSPGPKLGGSKYSPGISSLVDTATEVRTNLSTSETVPNKVESKQTNESASSLNRAGRPLTPTDENLSSRQNSSDPHSNTSSSIKFSSTVKSVQPSILIDILSLNSFSHVKELTSSGSSTAAELSELKESLNNCHNASSSFHQSKIKWEKEHIQLDFQIDKLKAQLRRDELNVRCTQEKLDGITLI